MLFDNLKFEYLLNRLQSIFRYNLKSDLGATLMKGAGGAFTVRVTGVCITFFSHIILARVMGASSYGIFAYAMTWLTVLSLFGIIGLDNASLRFVAEYNGRHKWRLLKGFINRSRQFSLVASFTVFGAASLFVWSIQNKIESELMTSLLVAFMIVPLYSFIEVQAAGLRAYKQVARALFANQILRPLLLLFGFGVLYFFFDMKFDATIVMFINFTAFLIALLLIVILFQKAHQDNTKKVNPKYLTKTWIGVALPMLLMNAMLQTEKQSDVLIIGFFLDADRIGIYAVAKKISLLISFGYYAVNAIAAPMIAELWYQNKKKELGRLLRLAAWGIFAFTLPVSLFMIFFGKQVLMLFGPEFGASYWPLVILSAGQIVNSMVGSVGALMIMTGYQKKASMIIGVSVVINIILNLVLIPLFDIVGAAVAMSASLIIWNVLMYVWVIKNLKIDPSIFRLR